LGGKYRVEHDLGRGSHGRVVCATHLALGQRVALKIIAEGVSAETAARFIREARLAARLKSAHAVKMLDAGEIEPGVPFIAMELLEGATLAAIVRTKGALPPHVACAYVAQACDALAEAHALGMVHRDVKTANLFVVSEPGSDGFVKVLDFGITKADAGSTQSVAPMTDPSALLGTPNAMAPEQISSSHDVDARADVWALGVVLHTLLSGHPPFAGKSLREIFEAILQQPAPRIDAPLPRGLAAVVDRCLRKNKLERWTDAAALATALAPFTRRSRSHARAIAITLAAFASASVGAALVVFHPWRTARVEAPAPTIAPVDPKPVVIEPARSGEELAVLAPVDASIPEPTVSHPSVHRPSAPPPSASVTSTPANDGLYLPKAIYGDGFANGFPRDLCKLMRSCYTETDAECEAVARPIVRTCVDQALPSAPDNMHDDRAANDLFAHRVSHCVVPEFHARQAALGRARAANCH
jgi:serine/threonine-protein kinase